MLGFFRRDRRPGSRLDFVSVVQEGSPVAKRRVVVTGMGIVSPVGSTVETAWNNVLAGRSGIGPVTAFDATIFQCASADR
jgi:hypothetical protein